MKKYLSELMGTAALVLSFLCVPNAISAQYSNADSTWTMGGNVAAHLNQVQKYNWSAGGDNLLGLNLQLAYSADYKENDHLWSNRLELEYGFNITDADGTRKSNDRIYLSSTYGYKLHDNLYFSGLLTYNTQFADGYKYGKDGAADQFISTLMAPGYLTIGTGLTWTPKTWFKASLTPVSYRGIFVLDDVLSDAGQFGVDPGKKVRTEFGAYMNMEVTKDIMKNVNLYSRVALYSNYLEKAQNVDVNWDLRINMSINKWLSASINTNLIYDDNIKTKNADGTTSGAKVQFQEVLGFGLQFNI